MNWNPDDEMAWQVFQAWYGREYNPTQHEVDKMNQALDAYVIAGPMGAIETWFDEGWDSLDSRRREEKAQQFDKAFRAAAEALR